MIIYHLPFTHQFFVGKLHSPSTSFPVLKIGQKPGAWEKEACLSNTQMSGGDAYRRLGFGSSKK